MTRFVTQIGTALLAFALTGCAVSSNPRDPLENFNRAMFTFNDTLDQTALKPAAVVYESLTPSFVQSGIGNFFGNLSDVWSAVNNLLQGKLVDGTSDFMRVALNSSFGLGGLLDIASEAGMPKHKEDFGQTLGKWGIASGPYIILPFVGSTTLRDMTALPVDVRGDLWSYKMPVASRNIGTVVRLVDQRAAVLDASNLIEEAAIDRYEFVRDAYLQRRESKVYDDGDIPQKKPKSSDDVPVKPSAEQKSSLNESPSLSDQPQDTVSAEPGKDVVVKMETPAWPK